MHADTHTHTHTQRHARTFPPKSIRACSNKRKTKKQAGEKKDKNEKTHDVRCLRSVWDGLLTVRQLA